MNRIDRLSAILLQLQSRSLVKAQDIADKFSISLRTVYRDVHALEEAGVPVIGEAGIGYRLMDGYKMPPIMFNREEASALLTASKLVLSRTDARTSGHYEAALDKIKAVLRHSEKDHLEDIDNHIAVITPRSVIPRQPDDLHLQTLLRAISGKNIIGIRYTSIEKNETLERKVEPVGIYNMGSHWYLVAYCQLRKDYRNFRTDKIARINFFDEKISQVHPPLQSFLENMKSERQVRQVVIAVSPEAVKYLGEQKYYSGFVREEVVGDEVYMTFLSGSLMGFARWYMLFGDCARIIEPLELNDMVAEIAEKILKKVLQPEMLLT